MIKRNMSYAKKSLKAALNYGLVLKNFIEGLSLIKMLG